ncbi:hypothetical protein KBC31_00060 [Candidatus Saccharibacteria bacterium]|nr:hypothetical protein [Candidatus Saccharibacteria bacterium]
MNEDFKQPSHNAANETTLHDMKNNEQHGFASVKIEKPRDQPVNQLTSQPTMAMQPKTATTSGGRYSGFFLTMLILASIVAFFSLFGSLFSFIAAIGFVSEGEPLVALATALNPVVNLFSLVSLGLLYFKKSAGLYLKFVTLSLAVLLAGFSTYLGANSDSFKKGVTDSAYEQSTTTDSALTKEEVKTERMIEDFFISSSAPIIFGSVALFGSLVWNSGAGILWFLAWRSQKKHDVLESAVL